MVVVVVDHERYRLGHNDMDGINVIMVSMRL